MNGERNTVFLRFSAPMQAWGTESRLQLRRSKSIPSKSGVIGLILCAMGVRREDAHRKLESLVGLRLGVRIDHAGVPIWDYHTVGAGIGIRQAKGGVKLTATTKEPEPQLSRREYLADASFCVAMQGAAEVIQEVVSALEDPVWPVFLGRKCCVPTEPVFAGAGAYDDLRTALESPRWVPRTGAVLESRIQLEAFVEHEPGAPVPTSAILVYDIPRTFKNPSHGPRWIVPVNLEVPVEQTLVLDQASVRRRVNYASEQWRRIRLERLRLDNGLCVFCKSPAEDVHHVTYERCGNEHLDDLRSLCRICHDACTQLEYGRDLREHRIDPSDSAMREAILEQVKRLVSERRIGLRQSVRESTLSGAGDFFAQAVGLNGGGS